MGDRVTLHCRFEVLNASGSLFAVKDRGGMLNAGGQ